MPYASTLRKHYGRCLEHLEDKDRCVVDGCDKPRHIERSIVLDYCYGHRGKANQSQPSPSPGPARADGYLTLYQAGANRDQYAILSHLTEASAPRNAISSTACHDRAQAERRIRAKLAPYRMGGYYTLPTETIVRYASFIIDSYASGAPARIDIANRIKMPLSQPSPPP